MIRRAGPPSVPVLRKLCRGHAAGEETVAEAYLDRLLELSRMPVDARRRAVVGVFEGILHHSRDADLNVFGLRDAHPVAFARETLALANAASLFLRDGGVEDARA